SLRERTPYDPWRHRRRLVFNFGTESGGRRQCPEQHSKSKAKEDEPQGGEKQRNRDSYYESPAAERPKNIEAHSDREEKRDKKHEAEQDRAKSLDCVELHSSRQ